MDMTLRPNHVTISGLASNPRRSFLPFREGVISIFNFTQLARRKAKSPPPAPSEAAEINYWLNIWSEHNDDLQKLPDHHAVSATTDACCVVDRLNSCSPIAYRAQSLPIL
jgi:hypothetical protein